MVWIISKFVLLRFLTRHNFVFMFRVACPNKFPDDIWRQVYYICNIYMIWICLNVADVPVLSLFPNCNIQSWEKLLWSRVALLSAHCQLNLFVSKIDSASVYRNNRRLQFKSKNRTLLWSTRILLWKWLGIICFWHRITLTSTFSGLMLCAKIRDSFLR